MLRIFDHEKFISENSFSHEKLIAENLPVKQA